MIKLVKLNSENYSLAVEMMDEWTAANEQIVPWAIRRDDYKSYEKYKQSLEIGEKAGFVPESTFFALDTERNIFVGAVNIRHRLNERLLLDGGHIGDGVRPSERGKGFATKMIALALDECKKLGIEKALMVCDKSNVASAKTIVNNGGVLENEIEVDGNTEQRYWITIR